MIAPGALLDRYTVQFADRGHLPGGAARVPPVVNSALVKKNEKDGSWGAAWLTINNEAGSGSYMMTRYDPAIGFVASACASHFMPCVGEQGLVEQD